MYYLTAYYTKYTDSRIYTLTRMRHKVKKDAFFTETRVTHP